MREYLQFKEADLNWLCLSSMFRIIAKRCTLCIKMCRITILCMTLLWGKCDKDSSFVTMTVLLKDTQRGVRNIWSSFFKFHCIVTDQIMDFR